MIKNSQFYEYDNTYRLIKEHVAQIDSSWTDDQLDRLIEDILEPSQWEDAIKIPKLEDVEIIVYGIRN